MREIELKVLIGAQRAKDLAALLPGLDMIRGEPRQNALRSIYFDTPEGDLRREKMALRLRHDGERWLQTVKWRGQLAGGLSKAEEDEQEIETDTISFEVIQNQKLRKKIKKLVPDPLILNPVLETRIQRLGFDVELNGTKALLALDNGEIHAGGKNAPLHELEIELVNGAPRDLYEIARFLLPDGGFRPSRYSKAARGFMLLDEGLIEPPASPRKAYAVPLTPEDSCEAALRAMLRECFDQLCANIEAVQLLDVPEGPHQLRIALRRLRSALAFADEPGEGEDGFDLESLREECRWLGREVGRLRDLDVICTQIIPQEAAAHPEETGFEPLRASIGEQAGAVRGILRLILTGPRIQDLLITLAQFIETGRLTDGAGTERGFPDAMGKALRKRWKRVMQRAGRIDTLDLEQRHALRKELKKLRYSLEFSAPLLPEKITSRFLGKLRALQVVFGDLNDATMVEALLTQPPFRDMKDISTQRAIGRILGARQHKAQESWERARGLWNALLACKRPWE